MMRRVAIQTLLVGLTLVLATLTASAQIPDPPGPRDPPVPNPQEPVPDPEECGELFPLFDFTICKAEWSQEGIAALEDWVDDQANAVGTWVLFTFLDWQTYLGCEIVGGPACLDDLNCAGHDNFYDWRDQMLTDAFCEAG